MGSETEKKERRRRPVGPQGLGDPDDKSLRLQEIDILIPQIKSKYIREEKCTDLIETYEQCILRAGLILGPLRCKEEKLKMNDCIAYWHDSDELLARAKQEYLEDRSEYRRTGVCRQNREYVTKLMQEKLDRGEDLYTSSSRTSGL